MKQHISIEQINELSEKGKEKLRKWWKPDDGDFIALYNPSRGGWLESIECSICDYDRGPIDSEIAKTKLPLLSIGQMIEFLDENKKMNEISHVEEGWYISNYPKGGVTSIVFDPKYHEELCDALWEAVKEVLER